MNHLRQLILRLQSLKVMKRKLKLLKVPNEEESIWIITQETILALKKTERKYRYGLPALAVIETVRRLKKRSYHCPIQYTLGMWYFRQLTIKVTPPLLIPRFQTENFTSLMIQNIRSRWQKGSKLNVIDFCCGTGVIGLSLLKQLQNDYDLHGTFIDINLKAIEYTKINAGLNSIPLQRITTISGDILNYLHLIHQNQVILANPPYLSQRRYRRLQKQVKLYEDPQALVSGPEGMNLVMPLLLAIVKQADSRNDIIAGVQYDGQSLQCLNLESKVVKDQYGRRRYVIL